MASSNRHAAAEIEWLDLLQGQDALLLILFGAVFHRHKFFTAVAEFIMAYLLASIREAFDCDRMLHLHVGAASVQWTS